MRLLSLTGLTVSPFRPLHLLVLRSTRALGRNDAVRSFMVAFAVIAAVVAASCDKVPLTSPTGSTILLSASTNIVPIDGSAEITATVTESAGTAVQNGTTVVFRADLGRMCLNRRRTFVPHLEKCWNERTC